VWDIPNYWIVY